MDASDHRIAEDLTALNEVGHRYAGSEAERRMLHQVRNRLPEGLVGRIEGFVAFTSPEAIVLVHAAALLGAGVLGFFQPIWGALLCGLVTAHLVLESSGGRSVLRWMLPKSASYNLVSWVAPENSLGTVVVTAPLDTPRWRPTRAEWLRRPLRLVVIAAVAVTTLLVMRSFAEPWGRPTQGIYFVSLGILATAVLVTAVAQRRVAGHRTDASAPVALLGLLRRLHHTPEAKVAVYGVFTGCAHAYQNGMAAFLAMHGERLKGPVLVIALDEPGRAPLGAVVSEGPLYPQHHRPTGPALVERLRWAGEHLPETDHTSVTDARVAMLWGYRALGLVGAGDDASTPETVKQTIAVLERLIHLYAGDLDRVEVLYRPDPGAP